MKPPKSSHIAARVASLIALRNAILEGASDRYKDLVDGAVAVGASDEEIDAVAHDAMRLLFDNAEQPVTPRSLAQARHHGQFRQ